MRDGRHLLLADTPAALGRDAGAIGSPAAPQPRLTRTNAVRVDRADAGFSPARPRPYGTGPLRKARKHLVDTHDIL